jgi:general secretion pathway protein G
MTVVRRTRKGGFTLVEILIVVIILGILAAIVIPQFTSASQDARKNSLVSQLQTLRSQLELYKLQHLDQLPSTLVGATPAWTQLTVKTDASGATGTTTAFPFGPYLQADPVNPLNSQTAVLVVTADPASAGAALTGGSGKAFVINSSNGKIWGTSAKYGYYYDESNPSNPTNDQ